MVSTVLNLVQQRAPSKVRKWLSLLRFLTLHLDQRVTSPMSVLLSISTRPLLENTTEEALPKREPSELLLSTSTIASRTVVMVPPDMARSNCSLDMLSTLRSTAREPMASGTKTWLLRVPSTSEIRGNKSAHRTSPNM